MQNPTTSFWWWNRVTLSRNSTIKKLAVTSQISSDATTLTSWWLNDMGYTPCKRDHHRQVGGGLCQGAILMVGNAYVIPSWLIIVGCSTIQVISTGPPSLSLLSLLLLLLPSMYTPAVFPPRLVPGTPYWRNNMKRRDSSAEVRAHDCWVAWPWSDAGPFHAGESERGVLMVNLGMSQNGNQKASMISMLLWVHLQDGGNPEIKSDW